MLGSRGQSIRYTSRDPARDDENRNIVYDRRAISTVATRVKEEGLKKWQAQWERAEKGALCRYFFFPTVEQRLKIRIPITPESIAFVSGHGKRKTPIFTNSD
jgi:hypothetical protein